MTRWTTAALVCACLALAACGGSDPVNDAGANPTSPDTAEGSEPTAPPDLSSEDQARMADQQSALADCMAERGYDLPDMGNGPGAPSFEV